LRKLTKEHQLRQLKMSKQETKHIDETIEQDWGSRNHIQTLVLMMSTVMGIYLCYRMAIPFLSALTWALTLAVLFAPLQFWLESRLKNANLAAIVTILLTGLIVIVPVIFVGEQLIEQAFKGSQLIEAQVNSGEWRRSLEAQPQLAPILNKIDHYIDLPEAVKTITAWLGSVAGLIVKGSVFQIIGLCLVLYVLFFFLRDRQLVLESIMSLSPLTQIEMSKLFKRVGDTIHATVYGTFAVASVQGLLGGLMFWWLGLPAPLLWGLVMGLLAIVPMLGAFIIWAPAALFLALQGNWGSALILTLWGMLVVGTVDNLLRPILVGNRLKLHTVLVFLSVVGGLILFGPAGVILGPVVLTITIALLEIWFNRNANESEAR
jgi:predicted PurR-regulated permease PerM